MSKGRVALYGVVLVIVAALGVRYWSDTHLPPVHPLKLTIVEKAFRASRCMISAELTWLQARCA